MTSADQIMILDLVLIDFDAYVKAWEELTQSHADRRAECSRTSQYGKSWFLSADRTTVEHERYLHVRIAFRFNRRRALRIGSLLGERGELI